MKKILLSLSFVFLSARVYAALDIESSMRTPLWRSSRTATTDSNVLLATGAIHFRGVVIGSPTLNIADSKITIYNSTSPLPFSVGNSTAFIINLGARIYDNFNSSGSVIFLPSDKYYDVPLSSGLAYDKRGNSEINILWDYIVPRNEPLVPFRP